MGGDKYVIVSVIAIETIFTRPNNHIIAKV